ncbi:MAG: hypothetical protein P1Q69_03450 [Candidatus Thorarchaeota archaeon]|nr:hypothetical protein [Candidatus Thorarchaeota archaeon]
MNHEETPSSIDVKQWEELVFKKFHEMGLDEMEGLKVKSIIIDFEETDPSDEPISDPNLTEDGIFRIYIRNTTPENGVKHFFATFVKDIESDLSFPVLNIVVFPFLYPLATFSILLSYIMTSVPADALTRWLVGPILFSLLVLPVLFYLEFKQRKKSIGFATRVKSRLSSLSLFTAEEVILYSNQLTKRKGSEIIYSFTMYVIGFGTLLFTLI